MPSRLRKTRKLGGHVSHSRGRGNAGGMHHHRVNFNKYHPGYFGEVGMRHYHLKRNQSFCPTINLDKLWTLVNEQTRVNAAKNKSGVAPIIDFKVLGKGKLPKHPIIVKAKFFSRRGGMKPLREANEMLTFSKKHVSFEANKLLVIAITKFSLSLTSNLKFSLGVELYSRLFSCSIVCRLMCAMTYAEVRGQLFRVNSLYHYTDSEIRTQDIRFTWQVLLLPTLSHQPKTILFIQ
ncbi:60S ribosomal protein L27a [Lemmus lemmus]